MKRSIYYGFEPMARMTRDEVRKLAELSRLSLTDEEEDAFTRELERILDYAERIQGLDVEGVEPTSHALLEMGRKGLEHPLREDEPRPGLDRERVLKASPDDGEGLFKVPRVLP